ncbi:MAG: ABC transporter substrate-binding protein [Eubacteriales bacterium]|nr:ABC transporter substrate-binding protein [Eubacteriales bacterium]
MMSAHLPKRLYLLMFKIVLLLAIAIIPLTGCQKPQVIRITVAEQYGLAYAPIQIMKENGYLDAALKARAGGRPYEITWVKLANTAAIQEAMVADTLDVAFVGIPPFLIGRDQGMDWSIFTGLSECPVELFVNDPAITNLRDLVGQGKIALPQPGSIQHILLAMAAEKELGDAKIFDQQLVSMKHPDGLQALINHQGVIAQYTAPPYNFIAAETPGIAMLSSGEVALGEPFSFIVGIAEAPFLADELRRSALQSALAESFAFIQNHPDEAAAQLATSFELSPETARSYLDDRTIQYGESIRGVQAFADFMVKTGYLKRQYNEQELVFAK